MDLDLGLCSAVVAGGKAVLREVLEEGVLPEHLFAEGRVVWEMVTDYAREYGGQPPSAEVVFGKLSIELPDVGEVPALFLAKEVLNRSLLGGLRSRMPGWVDSLETNDGDKALERIEAEVRALRQTRRSGRFQSLPSLAHKVWDEYERIATGQVGIPYPWPSLTELTLGLWPEDLVVFVARVGVGKCVAEDTRITDPRTGVPVPIKEVYAREDFREVVSWSERAGIHRAPIAAKVDTGTKDCLRFTYASGRSVVVTPEHPFLTAEGWRRAEELSVGQTAALPARVPGPSQPVPLPEAEVDLLALLLAEGSYTGHHTGFSTVDPEILLVAERAAVEVGGVVVKKRGECDYDFVRVAPSGTNVVNDLLRAHGLEGTLAKEKVLPDAIYSLPNELLARFLTVFWMCDGYVDASGACVCLASERMVRQLQHLLLRFGVQSSVSYKPAKCDGKPFDSWRLRVYSHSLPALQGVLGLWGEKGSRLSELAGLERNPNVGNPRVSDALVQRITELAATGSGRWKGAKMSVLSERLGHKRPYAVRDLFGPSNELRLAPFRAFCEVFGVTEEFRWLWDSDLYWDVLEQIEPVGPRRIYDLTVGGSHCFVANDILVHNTWASLMVARAAWIAGKRVLYVTTEVSQVAIARRFLALHFQIPYGDLRKGRLGTFAAKKFKAQLDEILSADGLYLVGGGFNYTFEGLEAAIQDSEPDLVVVDGAYLLKGVQGKSRTEQAAGTFDELKRTAKSNKVSLVATSQFNREVKNAKEDTISLDRIALTDAAAWNADEVNALSQTPDMKRDRLMDLIPLKNREGETGDAIHLKWDFQAMDFEEVPTSGGGDADEDWSALPPDRKGGAMPELDPVPF